MARDILRDIYKELRTDFYKYGVTYVPEDNKIIFDETEMLFENGSAKMKKPLRYVLRSFFPKYLKVLLKHKNNIDKVIIKGHTSSRNNIAKTLKEKYKDQIIEFI